MTRMILIEVRSMTGFMTILYSWDRPAPKVCPPEETRFFFDLAAALPGAMMTGRR